MNHSTPFLLTSAVVLLPTLSLAQTKGEFEALKKQVAALEQRLEVASGQSPSSELGKLKLSDSLTSLRLSGDLRLRYQYDNKDFQVDPVDRDLDKDHSPNSNQRSRWRFRLRLNGEFQLGPALFGGVQLATGQDNDTDNQTFENGFNDYGIYISRAYVGWNAADWLTLVAGKQPNPFYSTELTWDADINPTGLTESFALHKLFGHENVTEGLPKDGKTSLSQSESRWGLSLNLGQFIFDDNNEGNFDHDSADDSYLFVGQLVGTWNFSKNLRLTVAPGYMFFNAADVSGVLNSNGFSDVKGVSGETRKLSFITAPGDLSFKIGSIPAKFYWDFSFNPDGKGRVDDVYRIAATRADGSIHSEHQSVDDFAYLVGVQLGSNKKAGDWSLLANWRQTGIAGVDPNLNDSDFALSELNTRGVKLVATYSLTESLNIGVSYAYAWNLRDNLVGGQATEGAAVADSNVIQVFQVDLNLKF